MRSRFSANPARICAARNHARFSRVELRRPQHLLYLRSLARVARSCAGPSIYPANFTEHGCKLDADLSILPGASTEHSVLGKTGAKLHEPELGKFCENTAAVR